MRNTCSSAIQWLSRAAIVLIGMGAVTTACGREPSPEVDTGVARVENMVLQSPPRGDSAWAVIVAWGAFVARTPGYPITVSDYSRDGEDHLVTFSPTELGLGGSGTVRVGPDGTTTIVDLQQ